MRVWTAIFLVEMVVLSNVIIIFLRKNFSMEYFEFIQSYKRRTNVMTRCRIPEFCEWYKLAMGIYDPRSKRILPRNVEQMDISVYIQKNPYCVLWKKNRKDASLNGIQEIDKNFKYVENATNENNLEERIRYRFPKHETIDQLENVFVFDLETHNDQEFAEAFAAGLYDVNRLRDRWDRDPTVQEVETERKDVNVFAASNGNLVMNMFKDMERACKSCLDLISPKKTYSTDIIMLKRKPPNEYHQMLPHYEGEYKPNKVILILNLQEKLWWKKKLKKLWEDVSRGYITRWSVNRTWKTKIYLKTKRFLFMYSNMSKQIKSITIITIIGCETEELYEKKTSGLINF